MNKKPLDQVLVYQTKSGAIELKGDFEKETIWASQSQIESLFEVHQSVVSRHINNIFSDNEVDKASNMQKMHNAFSDKPVTYYSLDVLLAVGYRTNSKLAISFRRWATKTLRQHILVGYTLNKKRISKNYTNFIKAIDEIKNLLPQGNRLSSDGALELVKMFASTWLSLETYDKGTLPISGVNEAQVRVTMDSISDVLHTLKTELLSVGQASELFGKERVTGSTDAIVGNIFQSFDNQDLYPTVEEKAAHLLYFVVKDHPFVDGNKRNGAYLFIWFLQRAKSLNTSKMTPEALTALTLLVAESRPTEKSRVVGLIIMLLKNS